MSQPKQKPLVPRKPIGPRLPPPVRGGGSFVPTVTRERTKPAEVQATEDLEKLKKEARSPATMQLMQAIQEGPNKDPWRNLKLWQTLYENDPEFLAKDRKTRNEQRNYYFKTHILPNAKDDTERETLDNYRNSPMLPDFASHTLHGVVPFVSTRLEHQTKKHLKKQEATMGDITVPWKERVAPRGEDKFGAYTGEIVGTVAPSIITGGLATAGVSAFRFAPLTSRLLIGSLSNAAMTSYQALAGDAGLEDIGMSALVGAAGWGPKSKLLGAAITGGITGGMAASQGASVLDILKATAIGGGQVAVPRTIFESVMPATGVALRGYKDLSILNKRNKLMPEQFYGDKLHPNLLTGNKRVAALEKLSPDYQINHWMRKNGSYLSVAQPAKVGGEVVPPGVQERIADDRASIVKDGGMASTQNRAASIRMTLAKYGKAKDLEIVDQALTDTIKKLSKGTEMDAMLAYGNLERVLGAYENQIALDMPTELVGGDSYVTLTETGFEFLNRAGPNTRDILISLAHRNEISSELYNQLSNKADKDMLYSPQAAYVSGTLLVPGSPMSAQLFRSAGVSKNDFPVLIEGLLKQGFLEIRKYPTGAGAPMTKARFEAKGGAFSNDVWVGEVPRELEMALLELDRTKLPPDVKKNVRRTILWGAQQRTNEFDPLKHERPPLNLDELVEGPQTPKDFHSANLTMSQGGATFAVQQNLANRLPEGPSLETARTYFSDRFGYHLNRYKDATKAFDATMDEINSFDFKPYMGGNTPDIMLVSALKKNSDTVWPEEELKVPVQIDKGDGIITTVHDLVEVQGGPTPGYQEPPGTQPGMSKADPLKPVRHMLKAGVFGSWDEEARVAEVLFPVVSEGGLVQMVPKRLSLGQLLDLPTAGKATSGGRIVITTQTADWNIVYDTHSRKYTLESKMPAGGVLKRPVQINKKQLKDALWQNKGWILRHEMKDGRYLIEDKNLKIEITKTPGEIRAALANPHEVDLSPQIKVTPKASSADETMAEPPSDVLVDLPAGTDFFGTYIAAKTDTVTPPLYDVGDVVHFIPPKPVPGKPSNVIISGEVTGVHAPMGSPHYYQIKGEGWVNATQLRGRVPTPRLRAETPAPGSIAEAVDKIHGLPTKIREKELVGAGWIKHYLQQAESHLTADEPNIDAVTDYLGEALDQLSKKSVRWSPLADQLAEAGAALELGDTTTATGIIQDITKELDELLKPVKGRTGKLPPRGSRPRPGFTRAQESLGGTRRVRSANKAESLENVRDWGMNTANFLRATPGTTAADLRSELGEFIGIRSFRQGGVKDFGAPFIFGKTPEEAIQIAADLRKEGYGVVFMKPTHRNPQLQGSMQIDAEGRGQVDIYRGSLIEERQGKAAKISITPKGEALSKQVFGLEDADPLVAKSPDYQAIKKFKGIADVLEWVDDNNFTSLQAMEEAMLKWTRSSQYQTEYAGWKNPRPDLAQKQVKEIMKTVQVMVDRGYIELPKKSGISTQRFEYPSQLSPELQDVYNHIKDVGKFTGEPTVVEFSYGEPAGRLNNRTVIWEYRPGVEAPGTYPKANFLDQATGRKEPVTLGRRARYERPEADMTIEEILQAEANWKNKPLSAKNKERLRGAVAEVKTVPYRLRGILTPKFHLPTIQQKFGVPVLDFVNRANSNYLSARKHFRQIHPILKATYNELLKSPDQRVILDYVRNPSMRERVAMIEAYRDVLEPALKGGEKSLVNRMQYLLEQSFGPTWRYMLNDEFAAALSKDVSPIMKTWIDRGGLNPRLVEQGKAADLVMNAVSSRTRLYMDGVTKEAAQLIELIRDLPETKPPKSITTTEMVDLRRPGDPAGTLTAQTKTRIYDEIMEREHFFYMPKTIKDWTIKELLRINNHVVSSLSPDVQGSSNFMEAVHDTLGINRELVPRALYDGKILPIYQLISYAGTLPFRPSVVIKNTTQTLTTAGVMAGFDNYAAGLGMFLQHPEKAIAIARALNIREMSSVPLEHLLAGRGQGNDIWNKSLRGIRKVNDWGMVPLEIGDRFNRTLSACIGYKAVENFAPAFLNGDISLDSFLLRTGMIYLSKPQIAEILGKLTARSHTGLSSAKRLDVSAKEVGRTSVDKTGRWAELGTQNDYWNSPYDKALQEAYQSGDRLAIATATENHTKWEIDKVIDGTKPAAMYPAEVSDTSAIVTQAHHGGLVEAWVRTPKDVEVLVVAKTQQALDRVSAAIKSGDRREIGLSLGYTDLGAPKTVEPFTAEQSYKSRKISSHDWEDAAMSYARHLQEDTQWLYHAGNSAPLLDTKVGRFLGQFATWPVHFLGFMGRGLSTGNFMATAQFAGRFMAVNYALTQAGKNVFGIDPSGWLYLDPLRYAGGPGAEIATSIYDYVRSTNIDSEWRKDQALDRLGRATGRMIPFLDQIMSTYELLTDKKEWKQYLGMKDYDK